MSALPATAPTYDDVPYESFSYPQTHPAQTGAIARLFGVKTPEIETARVLELGCAGGGNLFPIACAYPQARLTGIDLSAEQIAQAKTEKKALGVTNVEFHQADILTFVPEGAFDYIICHGIYSWVPEAVRDKIFNLIGRALADNGVAIVSYNTLPGWNAVRSLREMMIYHTGRFAKAEEKIAQARALLSFLSDNVPEGLTGYRAVIAEEQRILSNTGSSYMYHDHLEGMNAQFYLHDVVGHAAGHGLAYVGDANLSCMFLGNMPGKAAEALQAVHDQVAQEQYMDFVVNRRFRSSLFCKTGAALTRALRKEQILDYSLVAHAALTVQGDDPAQNLVFQAHGANFTTHTPEAGAFFLELLAARPRPVPTEELIARAQKRLNLPNADGIRAAVVTQGMELLFRGYMHLSLARAEAAPTLAEKPRAFPPAAYEAGLPDRVIVSTLFGQSLTINAVTKMILQKLDGTKTQAEIAEDVARDIQAGRLNLHKDGRAVTETAAVRAEAESITATLLRQMTQNGLVLPG